MTSIYPSSTSSSSSTSSKNLLRISGMASGIDTDSVVKSMVSNYQAKIDKANQAKQTLQWKQEGYRDIIKGIKGLQDYFNVTSSKYILGGDAMNINSAVSDTNSVASATAASTATAGTYNMNVTQMAEQAKVEGESKNSLFKIPIDGSEWNNAKISLDGGKSYVQLGNITDSNSDGSILDDVASSINNNASLNSGITATVVNDGTFNHIKFTNKSGNDIDLIAQTSTSDLISNTTIKTTESVDYKEDGSKLWSGAKLAFNVNNVDINPPLTLDPITDTNSNGTVLDEVVSNINKQISSSSLNGKVSASYVSDGNSSYIKFTNTGASTDTIKLTGITSGVGTSLGTTNTSSINSGISSSTKLSDLNITDPAGISFNLSYDSATTAKPVSITATSSDTLQSLMDKVKSATSGAVTMSIDSTTGKISLQSKSYGSTSSITVKDTSKGANNISDLGINLDASKTPTAIGKDAMVSITAPGQATITTTQSSNQFTINGINYNLVNKGTANITVTANTDNVVKNFKNFIADYNAIISTINTKLTEKKNADYPPLTDDQKSSMSESQITAWETKAKVGVLRNDDYLNEVMTQLRGIFSSPVYSSYIDSTNNTKIPLSLGKYGSEAIGIDTSSVVTDAGKLVLTDETKLTNVIKNNFDDLKKMFSGVSSTDLKSINNAGDKEPYVGSNKYREDGMFTRMSTILNSYVATPGLGTDGTYTLSGSMNIFVNKQYDYSASGTSSKNTLPDQVYGKTLSITKLKTQMSAAETRYYAKFTALEKAMTKLNSQQSQLSSMLGTA